jgi:hypothetical protein
MMSSPLELDRSNVIDVDLGSAEFKANAHRHMAEWARRRPFYVLGKGPPQVVVGRYANGPEFDGMQYLGTGLGCAAACARYQVPARRIINPRLACTRICVNDGSTAKRREIN